MFCVIKRSLFFSRRAQFYRLRFAGKHIFYIFLVIRFPLTEDEEMYKNAKELASGCTRSINEMPGTPQNCLLISILHM